MASMAQRKQSATVDLKVRMKEPLRAALEAEARKKGHSLNAEAVDRLKNSFRSENQNLLSAVMSTITDTPKWTDDGRGLKFSPGLKRMMKEGIIGFIDTLPEAEPKSAPLSDEFLEDLRRMEDVAMQETAAQRKGRGK
jgi:hypothetical protein